MSILYKNSNGDITSLIPDMNNIDDSTVAADTTYSSEKIEGTYPITTTSTASPISTANGKPRAITIYGKSEIVDGTIKSAGEGYAVVDLGTLSWTYNNNLTAFFTNSLTSLIKPNISDLDIATNILTHNYKADSINNTIYGRNNMRIATNKTGQICISNFSYTDPEQFKTAMSGVLLCYQLADPTQGNCIAIKTDDGSGVDGTMATFSTGTPLRGIPNGAKDVAEWDGVSGAVMKNCIELDLGSIGWHYDTATFPQVPRFYSNVLSQTAGNDRLVVAEYYTPSRDPISGNLVDKTLALFTSQSDTRIYCINLDYTDASTFRSAMSGVKLIYELATPTTMPLTATENYSLSALKTYSPQTAITINDNPDFKMEAYANTANGQAVQSLETSIKLRIDEVKNEKNHFCYSYKIDLSDSNPATCVKPHFDTRYGCDNFSYTSAKMNYTTGVFDYGSWEGFIRRIARPCMLKYDGTVDYYLDPDDYSKKITGEASDVADVNYQGNAMVELEKLYFKRYTYNGIQYCFIADRKLDKSFKCYAHHDKYGKELDYIYRACYDGMYDGTRLRSISGVDYHNLNALTVNKIMSNTTRAEEIAFAQANNVASEQGEGWYILHKSEWDYINDILFLIGMSTDVQTTFGRGRDSGYVSTTDTGIISTGTMNDKGLFWGKNDGSAGVKVLGFENPWANLYKSMAGYINASGTQKTKQTYGTEDGSTVVGFNTDGTGYVAITGATPTKGDSSASGGGYITAWKYNDYGLIPYECTSAGSSAKFIPDYFYFNNNQTNFALVGGNSNASLRCGLCVNLGNSAGARYWDFGAALSYKPLSAA